VARKVQSAAGTGAAALDLFKACGLLSAFSARRRQQLGGGPEGKLLAERRLQVKNGKFCLTMITHGQIDALVIPNVPSKNTIGCCG